ncbi:hypothetical protein KJ632_00350 [Patescibacteria group bacterium]|nr:hypothetical protein [Patescibacteria group bacterium]
MKKFLKIAYKTNKGQIISFKSHYPKNNPENWDLAITDCLRHLGIFDGMEKSDKTPLSE